MAYAPVQSVTRALNILAAVNRGGLISVGELHQKTGIPKPTIVRLLQTLIAEGYVAHDKKTRGYHVTATVAELNVGFHAAPKVIDVAGPFATELTGEIIWPCAHPVPKMNRPVIKSGNG
jgi:IclR family mhp operon transcriptional activator